MTLPRSAARSAPRRAAAPPGAGPRRGLALGLALLTTLPAAARAADFEIRRVIRARDELLVYHDPILTPGEPVMRVELTRGGCDAGGAPVNVRLAGDGFATLIAIDRGEPGALGRWSRELLAGVADFLRVELTARRGAPDEYAVLDSYGAPPPREQPLTSSLPLLEGFLSAAPPPAPAGAAAYRRVLDATRLIEMTSRPLRAIVIVSDGVDPSLPSGSGAEDTLLVERSRRLGAPIFAVVIGHEPASPAQRATLQAAATRLQALAVRSGGGVIREVEANADLSPNLAQALGSFAQMVSSWQRTTCRLCGDVTPGPTAVELTALVNETAVARSRQPHATELSRLGEARACEQCDQAGDCRCPDGAAPTCREHRCRCVGACQGDAECREGERCREGRCRPSSPWFAVGVGVGALGLAALLLIALLGLTRRARAGERRRSPPPAATRGDAPRPLAPAGASEPPPVPAAAPPGEVAAPARARAGEAPPSASAASEQRPTADPAATRRDPRPPRFRLRAEAAGVADLPLAEGETVLGGDAGPVAEAVRRLPSGATGHPAVLAAVTVSGKHAVIHVVGRAVSVTDLGSTNGTFVNGERVRPHAVVPLGPGDRVAFSRQVSFVLEVTGAEEA